MAVYVYAPQMKEGMADLIKALGAERLVRFDGMNFIKKGKPVVFDETQDRIICWGACAPQIGKVPMLNSHVQFTSELMTNISMGSLRHAIRNLRSMQAYRRTDMRPPTLHLYVDDPSIGPCIPLKEDPMYARPLHTSTHEYRIHVIGKNLIVGKRVPIYKVAEVYKPGTSHNWMRSSEYGWKIDYPAKTKLTSLQSMVRQYVTGVCKLNFATVDVCCNSETESEFVYDAGYLRKLTLAPVLNGNLIETYISYFNKWLKGLE